MEENQVNVVVLESPGAFYRYVRALSDQLEGGRERFVLSHDGETLNMQEKCALLTDLFSLELNHKRLRRRWASGCARRRWGNGCCWRRNSSGRRYLRG